MTDILNMNKLMSQKEVKQIKKALGLLKAIQRSASKNAVKVSNQ
jgi:hypothetical protein